MSDPAGDGNGARDPSGTGDTGASCPSCGAVEHEFEIRGAAQMVAPPSPGSPSTGDAFTFVRCLGCGLIRLHPWVPETDIGRYYDPSYLPHRGASAWGRYARFVELGQRGTDGKKCRFVERAYPLGPEHRLLDVGCGQPSFLAMAQARTGAAAVGVDRTPTAWRDGDPRYAALELHRGTVESAPLTAPFQVITLWHVLEHDYHPLDLLTRLRALLTTDGALVVEVPDHDSFTRRRHGSHWGGYSTPRHTLVFTRDTLLALLERAGFTVTHLARRGSLDPFVLFWLGEQERLGRDLTGDLADRFAGFMAQKIATAPFFALERLLPMGAMVATARPRT